MKKVKKRVRGSKMQAEEIVINIDTVYVHSNIKKIEGEDLYEYDEIQYGKDEFIKKISERNKTLEKQATETQVALAEIFEMLEV